MSLNNRTYKASYIKVLDDVANEFYLPVMASSKSYDRVTGYFSSTIYIIAWGSLKAFVNNGGRIRILCSPYLSNQDSKAIIEGIESKNSGPRGIVRGGRMPLPNQRR